MEKQRGAKYAESQPELRAHRFRDNEIRRDRGAVLYLRRAGSPIAGAGEDRDVRGDQLSSAGHDRSDRAHQQT